jgi:hypothetical protein
LFLFAEELQVLEVKSVVDQVTRPTEASGAQEYFRVQIESGKNILPSSEEGDLYFLIQPIVSYSMEPDKHSALQEKKLGLFSILPLGELLSYRLFYDLHSVQARRPLQCHR